MNWFSFLFPKTIIRSHSRYNKSIEVVERLGKKELYVNGIQQSGAYTIKLWKKGLDGFVRKQSGEVKNILVLGIGGGTLFPLLHDAFHDAKIIAVYVDEKIISLYKKYFSAGTESYVDLICLDARKFLSHEKRRFNIIIIDIYTGNDVPEFVTGEKFHTSCYKRLASHGSVIFNYFSFKNQYYKSQLLLDKLTKIYQSVIRKRILHNVFYYCS